VDSAGKRSGIFNSSLVNDTILSSPQELIVKFFLIPMRITPFSSYVYRRSQISDLNLLYSQGRKHADVSFLIKVALRGKIQWIAKELMNYRIHGKNDSNEFDIKAIISLCRFLKKLGFVTPETISNFRVQNILVWLKQEKVGRPSKVQNRIRKVLKKNAFFHLIRNPKLAFNFLIKFLVTQ